MARTMKLSDIKISEGFAKTTPGKTKIRECRRKWESTSAQDRYIVVNKNGVLIDGYIQYLVLKELGIEDVQVQISERKKKRWHRIPLENIPSYKYKPTIYIYGHHPKNNNCNTYVWRIPYVWNSFAKNIDVGDTIFCNTKFGVSPVVVEKIVLLDKCPVNFPVKKMACKIVKKVQYSLIGQQNI